MLQEYICGYTYILYGTGLILPGDYNSFSVFKHVSIRMNCVHLCMSHKFIENMIGKFMFPLL